MFDPRVLSEILGQLGAVGSLCLAYSGGLDSQVLLYSLSRLPNINLKALHVHHGLSPNADAWAEHCRKICEELAVPFYLEHAQLDPKQANLEEAARKARYAIFLKYMTKETCLLTAHNQNDQAETLLLQLLRGAGLRGLAAMPMRTEFGAGQLVRPLLNISRADLQAYAMKIGLEWVEDESNANCQFDRNYLRHKVMPLLAQRWPAVNSTLARSALHCANANQLLEDLAQQDLLTVQGKTANTLAIDALLSLNTERQANVLRYWLRQLKFPQLTSIKIREIQKNLLSCRQDAKPKINAEGVEIRRYQNQLYAMNPVAKLDTSLVIPWDLSQPLILPDNLGVIDPQELFKAGLQLKHNQNISLRFRQGGESCRPLGRKESHHLKKLLQEWGVPPWLRPQIPLLYQQEKIIAVVGYCVCVNEDQACL